MSLALTLFTNLVTIGVVILLKFKLSDYDINKLTRRFNLFQKERKIIHDLLNSYLVDYRQYSGSTSKRYEYLRKKYISRSPDLSHLVFNDENILWSLEDISIILGRHLTTITRTFEKLETNPNFYARLLVLRETTKAKNGHNIYVYRKEIFDLIIDLYEYEYLLRFTEPRRGNINKNEVQRFWEYLRELENYNSNYLTSQKKYLPDIPSMSLQNIISLIWEKVFNVKIWTVSSVIFGICFEIARRFLAINLWFATIPALITICCILLIYNRKLKPDILSDLGAGALLFTLLWVSTALSYNNNLPPENEIQEPVTKIIEPVISITPVNYNELLYFNINSNINAKEYFYRISPDKEFHSTGFILQNDLTYPNMTIKNSKTRGTINLEIKYLADNNIESKIWEFYFNIENEKFNLDKKFILSTKEAWVEAKKTYDYPQEKYYVTVDVSPVIFSNSSQNVIESCVYGINKEAPDITINLVKDREKFDKWYAQGQLLEDKDNYIKFISSYLIFKDNSSSDIRISRAE